MEHHSFSKEQLAIIDQLSKVFAECRIAGVTISGITEYEVFISKSTNGDQYVVLS